MSKLARRALVSVSDKSLLGPFAATLIERGFQIVSTGGTAKFLSELGIRVTDVAEVTGFPEMMGGRLKSMHPKILGGLLGRPDNPQDVAEMLAHTIGMFGVVCCNLYPFEQTIAQSGCTQAQAIEKIDVGGPTMIRAAAKNSDYLYVVTHPSQYDRVLDALHSDTIDPVLAQELSCAAFGLTAAYDVAIYRYKCDKLGIRFPDPLVTVGHVSRTQFRYGENPHQKAQFYSFDRSSALLGGTVLKEGKGFSYVNSLDMSGAFAAVDTFDQPTVCIVKHASPCGMASAETVEEAYALAHASDTKSAMGGVIAVNCTVTAALAKAIGTRFVECIVAPAYDDDALEILDGNDKKKRRRLLVLDRGSVPTHEIRSTIGGFLVQEVDRGDPVDTKWNVQSERQPTAEETRMMRFGWQACRPVQSNAIVLVQGTATVGIGGGQPNRVDCVKIAIERAGEKAKGAVMASDSFFPFDDSIRLAAGAGITAAIYQGGGDHEGDVIRAANELGLALVATGVRHFHH